MWDQLGQDDGTFEHLHSYLGEMGFGRAVVFAPFHRWFDGDPNAWTLEQAAKDARFIPWVTLQEPGPAAAADLRKLAARGARGVKLHPAIIKTAVDDPALEPVWAVAEEFRLPVLIHTGPHGWHLSKYRPALVDEVAQRHPKLPLIIEHMGGAGLCREAYAVMANSKCTYGGLTTCLNEDATWAVPPDEIRMMIGKFGAERFIFGSDFPWNSVEQNKRALAVLDSFKLPPSDLDLILTGNIERLVGSAGGGVS